MVHFLFHIGGGYEIPASEIYVYSLSNPKPASGAVPGLAYIPDDLTKGGIPGHGVITPVTPDSEVDQVLLDDWAASRNGPTIHRLTHAVLDAIVEHDVRSSE